MKAVLAETNSTAAQNILLSARKLAAPQVLLPECANALNRRWRLGEITQAGLASVWQLLKDFPIDLHDTASLTWRALEISMIAKLNRVNDSLYLALAEEVGIPLLTADEKFAKAVRAVYADAPMILLSEITA